MVATLPLAIAPTGVTINVTLRVTDRQYRVTDAGPLHGGLSLGLSQRADATIVVQTAGWLSSRGLKCLTLKAPLARESNDPIAEG